jgi:cytoskeleton protein RodZ
MASTPFGEHLRRERELRGVTLDEVSAATRIKTTFLEAMENGRWEELPGGAFNRGFIRATSKFLGLDEDGMIAEYALETGTVEQNKPIVEPPGALPRDYRPAVIAVCVVLVALIAGGWLGHQLYAKHKQKRLAAEQSVSVDSSAPADTASPLTNAAATSTAPDAASPISGATAPAAGNSQPASTVPSIPAAAVATAPAVLKLTVDAIKKTDVKISGDGKVLFKGRMHSDSPKTFEAKDGFEVTAGEADRLRVELNGQKIPFAATKGRRGSISLDRKDLKSAPAR